jgi:chromosome partitioning protein
VDVGYFSVDGLENMLEIVERIKHSHNPSLNLFGILVTKFDARTTLAQTTIETIRKAGLPLLEPPIRICVDIIRAQMQRVPITALAPESTAAMDYAGLASYLLHPHVTKQPKVVRLRRVNGGRA